MAFSATSTAAMVFSFLYVNFDRMCVLGLQDIKGLGKYQAVISLVMLVEYVPKLLQIVFIPVFSSLLAKEEHRLLIQVQRKLVRA